MPTTDWNPVLRGEFAKPYWAGTAALRRRGTGRSAPIYPPHDDVFAALHLTPYADTKVMILGQDPYHGPGPGARSLLLGARRRRQAAVARQHLQGAARRPRHRPAGPRLRSSGWARQGVLLLNTTLTVRAGQAASHQGKGWETFTDEMLAAVNAKPETVVFILWGAVRAAQEAR